MVMSEVLTGVPLGQASPYINQYQPDLLFPIARSRQREALGITDTLPFQGYDYWRAFELSWLDQRGKPQVAIGELYFPCASPNLIESKSLKLYFNSFNNSQFADWAKVQALINQDLTAAAGAPVQVVLKPVTQADVLVADLPGQLLDNLPVACDRFLPHPDYLHCSDAVVQETLHSHLLKSNCLVTGQPDWASVLIQYYGRQINAEGLLKYIISFRDLQGFHEQCVEHIFHDILQRCQPENLTVHAFYTRRGGIDINSLRTTLDPKTFYDFRTIRQ
ncbi:MAG: NADPH-dependent 7-cyano-7-deazaguanine reductase QueF [Pseudomonadota bacterium]|nr:NADPH-dependent 7-cyano-7-deazaguanine reductase QueF [Pseudomonadota bacterium]